MKWNVFPKKKNRLQEMKMNIMEWNKTEPFFFFGCFQRNRVK